MVSCFQLLQQDLISEQDYIKVEFLSAFARYIHNTDTHLGNISFAAHREGFSLLPIYDMCSMGFAPKSNGELAPLGFNWPESVNVKKVALNGVKRCATRFWNYLAQEPLLSEAFRQFIHQKVIPQIPT